MHPYFISPGNQTLRALTPVMEEFIVMVATVAHPIALHLRGDALEFGDHFGAGDFAVFLKAPAKLAHEFGIDMNCATHNMLLFY